MYGINTEADLRRIVPNVLPGHVALIMTNIQMKRQPQPMQPMQMAAPMGAAPMGQVPMQPMQGGYAPQAAPMQMQGQQPPAAYGGEGAAVTMG